MLLAFSWRACAYAGLLRRFAPRNDGEFILQFSNSPCLPCRRARLPQVYRLQGSPLAFTGFFSTTAAPNRCPTYARKGVRSAGRCGCPQPRCTRQRTRAHPRLRSTSVHSRLHACAPHAVGLCGLLHVPGSAAFAHSPRSCELSPGHALGPSSVSPASHPRRRLGTAVPEASGARCRKDQPHPAPRIEDDRDAPSTGTGQGG